MEYKFLEDGNNIGVEIQTETIDVISHIENDIRNQFDSFSTYFQSRGDLIVKVAKYPHAEDFRRAVQERDQKFDLSLCVTLTDIRNYYASLHDLVTKNLKKIKKPKSEDNKDFLY
jgi:proteasome activator subunit 3 (PA28 gamma)